MMKFYFSPLACILVLFHGAPEQKKKKTGRIIDSLITNDLNVSSCCFAVWGACNHAFHLHCILKWVNSQTPQPHCPMCRREWQFKG